MKEIELKFSDKIVGIKQVVISELKNFKHSPSAWLNKDSKESNVMKESIFLGIADALILFFIFDNVYFQC